MKVTKQESSVGIKMVWHERSRATRKTFYVLCGLGLFCFGSAVACFAADSDKVAAIAEGLLQAEQQFSNLRIDYIATRRDWNAPNEPFRIVEGVYAQKKVVAEEEVKVLRYLGRKGSVIYPATEVSEVSEDECTSYDGEATMFLDRKAESDKPMQGMILAGYVQERFPKYDLDPHTQIWHFDGRSLGQILKDNIGSFRIESENEKVEGTPAVKLVGTIWGGKAEMALWVSPERGFLPVKREFKRPGGESLFMGTIVRQLVQLPNGAWYPMQIQSPALPLDAPRPRYFLTYEISKISVKPIPSDFFSFNFPPGTRVWDDILKVSYLTY